MLYSKIKTQFGTLLRVALAIATSATLCYSQTPHEAIEIDAQGRTTTFPHFWEQSFGSGRAILSLRESYRNDLRTVKQATEFKSVRFHGILMDEVGLYDPNRVVQTPGLDPEKANDLGTYNFSYIDQIYDGLLENGVRPFVELSFMPSKMAADPKLITYFFYRPISSPPKDYALWDGMMSALARHLIDRYGIEEVATWRFEVWNEPNLGFWGGKPKQDTYFELYDHTARALKSVSARLQVGGPSTAQAAWVTPFLVHAKDAGIPVDFVSTHVYANDKPRDIFGTDEKIPRDQLVWRAVEKVHEEIVKSSFSKVPLVVSEYNASAFNEPNVEDSIFMGPWLANDIRLCDGLTDDMSYWSFSDVFEEQGIVRTPFYGGYGLIAAGSIPKPALNAFRALHQLGDRRIALDSESALATADGRGRLALALWNYAPPDGEGRKYTFPPKVEAPTRTFDLSFDHVRKTARVQILRVDRDHGNVLREFDAMGRPPGDLSKAQVDRLRKAGEMAPAELTQLHGGKLTVVVPTHGLAVVLVDP